MLYIPTGVLESILFTALIGVSLSGLPLRTRSKVVKEKICKTLGYDIPPSFKKTQPRFPGQNFDVYIQKSLKVQIWNEEVDTNRRYVFLRVNEKDLITSVRVIEGTQLITYNRTGKRTYKYQARMSSFGYNLCSKSDTETIASWILNKNASLSTVNPTQFPSRNEILPISEIYKRLLPLVGQTIDYINSVQERNRGAELHAQICKYLGYSVYEDNGSYPDIANQLLEVKLQTSPTIDLGLYSPEDGTEIVNLDGILIHSQDIRYAIFDAEVLNNKVRLNNLYLVTGQGFTNYFNLFKGKGTNAKIQLSLPSDFFAKETFFRQANL